MPVQENENHLPPDFQQTTRNIAQLHDEKLSLGQKMADRLAAFAGSWVFILSFLAVLIVWMVYNSLTTGRGRFDPYPFILLNLVLSCMAAIQAPVIMMSQDRTESRDRLRDEEDYEVNRKAEHEIAKLHHQLHHLRGEVAELHTLTLKQSSLISALLGRESFDETQEAGEE